jgi:DNA-binding NarL/FixJ family response regulator
VPTTGPAGTPPGTALRVLIVDDDARIRRGLREVLALSRELAVVGEAATAQHALDLDRTLQPDVVIIDLLLPRAADGLRLLAELAIRGRAAIAISVRADLESGAIAAGARVFLGKGSRLVERLVPALQAAADTPGGTWTP